MKTKISNWKKGAGKLGVLTPLLGSWQASTESPMGKVTCTRTFTKILGGKYIQLVAHWQFGNKIYEEFAVYGLKDNKLSFWSFTSDGKRSEGVITDGKDVDPNAIAFEAQMPAGLARMIHWPNEDSSINWVVEARNKKGWKRFTQHKYLPI